MQREKERKRERWRIGLNKAVGFAQSARKTKWVQSTWLGRRRRWGEKTNRADLVPEVSY